MQAYAGELLTNSANSKEKTAIVGARGYAGLELARILLDHPGAELTACFATDTNWKLSDYLVNNVIGSSLVHSMKNLESLAENGTFKTAFLATPAEVSLELAPKLLAKGVNVIDLSGAFRITSESFEKWYGRAHSSPELLATAEYGLVPWVGPAPGKRPSLVANPGCYATSILMAILPLLKYGVIQPEALVIDAKSGTSGAGRKAAENLLFTEVDGECLPYRVGKHQHLPEICQIARKLTGIGIDPMFTTHLLPVRRGIIAGIYARLAGGQGAKTVQGAFDKAYSGYSLIHCSGESPRLLSLKRVVGSARTQITYNIEGDKLYLFSAIDNLLKGAASQAVENFNRLIDVPVTTGLPRLEGVII